jgi:CHAT domain-containing protein
MSLSPKIKKWASTIGLCALVGTALSLAVYWHSNIGGTILFGQRSEGTLGESDPIRSGLPLARKNHWILEGSKGQQITITVESYEFDAYLLLLDPLNHQIAWADNNGGFFNAQIRLALPSTGRYTVVVSGANADQFGTYWLSLEEGDHEADLGRAAAESFYREGIAWGDRMKNPRAISWLNLGMAQYLRERGERDEAEKYYARALEIAEGAGFVYGRWAAALDRCRLFTRRLAYDQAARQLEQALGLSRQLSSRDEAETRVMIEFGNLYYSSARAGLAQVYYRNAAKQAEKYALPSLLVELYTSTNEFLRLEDKERAIEYAEKAYPLSRGLDPVLQLKAIHALAGTYLFLEPHRSQEGLALAAEMRNRARQLGCRDEEIAATNLMSMGMYAAKRIDEMIGLAGEALELTSPTDENPAPRRIALQLLADGQMLKEDYMAALQLCLEALQAVENAWAKETIEELRRELLSQSKAICTQIIAALHALNARQPSQEYARQAFDYAERSRSRSLLEQVMKLQQEAGAVPAPEMLSRDQEILERISAVRGQLVLLGSSGNASRSAIYSLLEQRASLIAERMQLQGEIRGSTETRFYAAQLSPLTAEEAQKMLVRYKPNAVILHYQLGIQESFLIALTARSTRFYKLPDRGTITKAIAEWRAQITGQVKKSGLSPEDQYNYARIAHQLYDMLMKPASHLIEGRDLIIVPSDSLFRLPFESLVVDRPESPAQVKQCRYVVEKHPVTYVPSVSVLSEIENRRQQPRPDKLMLIVGDPFADDSDNDVVAQKNRESSLDQLPAARREVQEIAALAERYHTTPTLWLGPEASENKFKKSDLSVFRYIHLATHGISDRNDGEASALTLSADRDGIDDGILTGGEITQLKLNSDLVVLSGCETAAGQEAGAEGIVSVNRAFLISGARCVCGSLWPVDDSWTQKLMTDFYAGFFAKGLDASQALRMAKLTLLKGGAAPFHWAPFIFVGSSR